MTKVTRLGAGLLLAVLVLGCTPIPEDFGRSTSPGATGGGGSVAPSASLGLTVDGSTVRIVGLGQSTSDSFELPAGKATLKITACQSNQVMPFITLLDPVGNSAGLIVDPEKTITVAGGTYRVQAQANPDCLWQVEITPAG